MNRRGFLRRASGAIAGVVIGLKLAPALPRLDEPVWTGLDLAPGDSAFILMREAVRGDIVGSFRVPDSIVNGREVQAMIHAITSRLERGVDECQ